MSKPSYDVLKFLVLLESQEAAPYLRRSTLPPLQAEGLTPARAAVLSPLPTDLAELAEQADARAERIYNEKINILPRSREEETAVPVTPNSSPLEPSPHLSRRGCFTAWDNKTTRRGAARPSSSVSQSRVVLDPIAKAGSAYVSSTLNRVLVDQSHRVQIPQDLTPSTSVLSPTIHKRC